MSPYTIPLRYPSTLSLYTIPPRYPFTLFPTPILLASNLAYLVSISVRKTNIEYFKQLKYVKPAIR